MPPPHFRQQSMGIPAHSSGPSPILVAKINEKRMELENLKKLQELSAAMANQLEALQEKLSTLTDGTEAVAAVMSNWHNVLRAIQMASMKIPTPKAAAGEEQESEDAVPLPQTLVRIPTQQQQELEARSKDEEDAA